MPLFQATKVKITNQNYSFCFPKETKIIFNLRRFNLSDARLLLFLNEFYKLFFG
jgi:hypothetical protein